MGTLVDHWKNISERKGNELKQKINIYLFTDST